MADDSITQRSASPPFFRCAEKLAQERVATGPRIGQDPATPRSSIKLAYLSTLPSSALSLFKDGHGMGIDLQVHTSHSFLASTISYSYPFTFSIKFPFHFSQDIKSVNSYHCLFFVQFLSSSFFCPTFFSLATSCPYFTRHPSRRNLLLFYIDVHDDDHHLFHCAMCDVLNSW